MKIHLEYSVDHWRADLLDLPGTPPVGLGRTEALAVACLFWRLMYESTGGSDTRPWLDSVEKSPIIVNDEIWHWPDSYCNS